MFNFYYWEMPSLSEVPLLMFFPQQKVASAWATPYLSHQFSDGALMATAAPA